MLARRRARKARAEGSTSAEARGVRGSAVDFEGFLNRLDGASRVLQGATTDTTSASGAQQPSSPAILALHGQPNNEGLAHGSVNGTEHLDGPTAASNTTLATSTSLNATFSRSQGSAPAQTQRQGSQTSQHTADPDTGGLQQQQPGSGYQEANNLRGRQRSSTRHRTSMQIAQLHSHTRDNPQQQPHNRQRQHSQGDQQQQQQQQTGWQTRPSQLQHTLAEAGRMVQKAFHTAPLVCCWLAFILLLRTCFGFKPGISYALLFPVMAHLANERASKLSPTVQLLELYIMLVVRNASASAAFSALVKDLSGLSANGWRDIFLRAQSICLLPLSTVLQQRRQQQQPPFVVSEQLCYASLRYVGWAALVAYLSKLYRMVLKLNVSVFRDVVLPAVFLTGYTGSVPLTFLHMTPTFGDARMMLWAGSNILWIVLMLSPLVWQLLHTSG